ncbi:MAG: polyprenyl synthetase family protein, partial [Burkholderiaceae bacterium]|nr:polyprenyl synthetase family protein [Burkholderiaceae bacterium]
ARLFEAASQLGAMLCKASPGAEAAAAEYGRRLGTAFQLIDDVLDYSGVTGDIGKQVGTDLREGKPTLPLIHVMERGTPAERALVREAIEQGATDQFDPILEAIRRTGALDYTRQRASEEAQAARDAVAAMLPPQAASVYRDALLYLAAYSIERDH